jgi:hypothetical protein
MQVTPHILRTPSDSFRFAITLLSMNNTRNPPPLSVPFRAEQVLHYNRTQEFQKHHDYLIPPRILYEKVWPTPRREREQADSDAAPPPGSAATGRRQGALASEAILGCGEAHCARCAAGACGEDKRRAAGGAARGPQSRRAARNLGRCRGAGGTVGRTWDGPVAPRRDCHH